MSIRRQLTIAIPVDLHPLGAQWSVPHIHYPLDYRARTTIVMANSGCNTGAFGANLPGAKCCVSHPWTNVSVSFRSAAGQPACLAIALALRYLTIY